MIDFDMSQYKELFIEEAQENLQGLNQALLQLEKEPSDVEPLNEIFRLAHTIKGMAATMGYDDMALLAHSMEDLLDELRQGTLEVEPQLFDLLFECLDALGTMLEDVVADREGGVALASIMDRLEAYQEPTSPPVAPAEAASELAAAPAEVGAPGRRRPFPSG